MVQRGKRFSLACPIIVVPPVVPLLMVVPEKVPSLMVPILMVVPTMVWPAILVVPIMVKMLELLWLLAMSSLAAKRWLAGMVHFGAD